MASEADTGQILRNLEAEPCLDAGVEAEFFRRLEVRAPFADCQHAWSAAQDSVWSMRTLNCQRAQVPPDRFQVLVRFTLPAKIPTMFPRLDTIATGLTSGDLDSIESDRVQELVDEALLEPDVLLGPLVWATESTDELEAARVNLADLFERLGLDQHLRRIAHGECCMELRYRREHLPDSVTLNVPSALDGIDNPAFRPVSDCDAPCGLTEPLLPGGGVGFPEAVHRGCTVTTFGITLVIP